MKLKKLATVFASLSLISSFAHANVLLKTNLPNVCSQISGKWTGNGSVEALGGVVSCGYHGVGTIVKSHSGNAFSMNIDLRSNSSVCPDEQLILAGTCERGTIALHTDSANLSGTVSANANHADMNGDVYIDVNVPWIGHKSVDAKVTEMKLDKLN